MNNNINNDNNNNNNNNNNSNNNNNNNMNNNNNNSVYSPIKVIHAYRLKVEIKHIKSRANWAIKSNVLKLEVIVSLCLLCHD